MHHSSNFLLPLLLDLISDGEEEEEDEEDKIEDEVSEELAEGELDDASEDIVEEVDDTTVAAEKNELNRDEQVITDAIDDDGKMRKSHEFVLHSNAHISNTNA